mmetsp:Transcript_16372/g.32013  ORF Transcript_16372/g.32013 Transcript_16372/m.32013 type:complete len:124 (-) Transcript_16372:28-399(-)
MHHPFQDRLDYNSFYLLPKAVNGTPEMRHGPPGYESQATSPSKLRATAKSFVPKYASATPPRQQREKIRRRRQRRKNRRRHKQLMKSAHSPSPSPSVSEDDSSIASDVTLNDEHVLGSLMFFL